VRARNLVFGERERERERGNILVREAARAQGRKAWGEYNLTPSLISILVKLLL